VALGRYVGELFCGELTRENKVRVLSFEREVVARRSRCACKRVLEYPKGRSKNGIGRGVPKGNYALDILVRRSGLSSLIVNMSAIVACINLWRGWCCRIVVSWQYLICRD
jgi:hypothetical protein